MPDTELVVASGRSEWPADDVITLKTRRLPYLGREEGWVVALAWHPGLSRLEVPGVDVVVSLELCSLGSQQARRLAERLGVPHGVLIFENRPDNAVYRFPPWRWWAHDMARRTDFAVCFSELARQHAIALGAEPARCATIHPGVDVELFSPRPDGRCLDPVVMYVGQVRQDRGENKGITDMVAACDLLKARNTPLKLVVIGDGPQRPALEEMARSRPYLEVLGPKPRERVSDYLKRARVFAMASKRTYKWSEQFGFSLVEAMASGLPVVSTRSGSIPEIVPPWNPLVPEGDISGLAQGIFDALGEKGDSWGRQNREDALRRFDLHTQGLRLRQVLEAASRNDAVGLRDPQ